MRSKGTKYENLALKHLQSKGLNFVERNIHCRAGEVDLLMQDSDTLVFVEVRFRNSANYGSAIESVTPTKQARIINTAKHYLHKNNLWSHNVRFDIVAIQPVTGRLFKRHKIDWIKAAFEA